MKHELPKFYGIVYWRYGEWRVSTNFYTKLDAAQAFAKELPKNQYPKIFSFAFNEENQINAKEK